MHYIQYEELCRLFIADKYELSIEEVRSVRIQNPQRPGLRKFHHQIDLYWEDGNEVALYLNIADAKWRGSDKVCQEDMLKLQKVREKVAAQKAIMITNTDFTDGAKGAAEDEGNGLHIVRPDFDLAILDPDLTDRKAIQIQLNELKNSGKPVYDYKIIRRALDSETVGTFHTSVPEKINIHTKDINQTPVDQMVRPSLPQGETTRIQKVTGGQGSSQTGRQGGPPSGRQDGSGPKGSESPRGGGGPSNRRR